MPPRIIIVSSYPHNWVGRSTSMNEIRMKLESVLKCKLFFNAAREGKSDNAPSLVVGPVRSRTESPSSFFRWRSFVVFIFCVCFLHNLFSNHCMLFLRLRVNLFCRSPPNRSHVDRSMHMQSIFLVE